ncbi:MAG TPA: hypothetical protein VG672_10185, partial [Bryobacteraceae bacterium]|nr:hypothetical protein [Bryobacteraceae bacterium]
MTALFGYGAWLRWTDGFAAITTSDSFEYLQGALTGDLNQVAWRTFVYPLFLKLCVEHLGGLVAVVALQKFLGLLAGALTFATWMKLKGVIGYRSWGVVLHDTLGLLLLAMMLLSWASTRYFELSIMLESLSTFALAAVVFAAGGLGVALARPGTRRQVPWWAGALVGLSLFANALNPRFSPIVVLSVLLAVI